MAELVRINLHPVKSFDAQSVDRAELLACGALANDRRYALRDREGEFINGKRTPAMHLLRSTFDLALGRLALRIEGTTEIHAFDVDAERPRLNAWLSDYFSIPLEIIENTEGGFPDDTDSPGPTLLSTATLEEVAKWFDGLRLDDVRARFRANLEIDGVEPFWEDRLVAAAPQVVCFQIGAVEFLGTNPCQRCVVPTRGPHSGKPIEHFTKIFTQRRETALPDWAPSSRFDHFYRLAVNTRLAESKQGTLRVGDQVRILGVV
jgi:uncharacterized protein YcbX